MFHFPRLETERPPPAFVDYLSVLIEDEYPIGHAAVPERWGEEDYHDIEELYALLTRGEYEFKGRYSFSGTCSHISAELAASLTPYSNRRLARRFVRS